MRPDQNLFDGADYSGECATMATVLLYYHSPCVNTQATYSKAKPITIIVNADVIQCVLIVYVCMPRRQVLVMITLAPPDQPGATLTTQYSQPLPAASRPVCGYCTAGGLDAMGRSTWGPFEGVWLLHTVYQINSAFCLHLPQVRRR